jgi:hypothetical protein
MPEFAVQPSLFDPPAEPAREPGRPTDTEWLLSVLADGRAHTHTEILSRSFAARGCGLTIHSRISDLRDAKHGGHVIACTVSLVNGRRSSKYQLLR